MRVFMARKMRDLVFRAEQLAGKADPSLAQLAAMPPGMQADRLTRDAPWEFRSFSWKE